MNQLVPISSRAVPALVATAGERASIRFLEFFAANIRNPHTRRAYYRAAEEFLGWCASVGVPSITAVHPVHVAAWIEAATRELAAPSVKQWLAALRHLFDWLVNGQVIAVNLDRGGFSGRGAVNCRLTRLSGHGIAALLIVVRTVLPRTTPCRPILRIRRATVQRATAIPSRLSCRQTLRTP